MRPYTDPMDTVIDVFSTIIGIVAAILAYLSSDSVAQSDLNTTMQNVLSYSVMGTLAIPSEGLFVTVIFYPSITSVVSVYLFVCA